MAVTVSVRRAGEGDHAFLVAGNVALARESEGLALDEAVVRRGVAACLADPAKGFYLVAEDDAGQRLGQLMVTTEWSDWRDGVFFWIQSVYVIGDARRRGVYAALHNEVIRLSEAAGNVVGVRLYVHRDNVGAMATYRRMGMSESHYALYEAG